MTRRSPDTLALFGIAGMVACVSFDPSAPRGPDIGGTYTATVVTSIANSLEVRTDTFAVTLGLRSTGIHGRFVGTYRIAPGDSGPVAGEFLNGGVDLLLTVLGDPPKPIAGVAHIRALYPRCVLSLLGMPALTGRLTGDSLTVAEKQGAVPCLYENGSESVTVQTAFAFLLNAER